MHLCNNLELVTKDKEATYATYEAQTENAIAMPTLNKEITSSYLKTCEYYTYLLFANFSNALYNGEKRQMNKKHNL